jgi:superfamily II DNA or RNA helicase
MKPRVYSAPPECLPDLVGVKSKDGEFNTNDLVSRINKMGLIGGIVDHVKRHWRKNSLGVLFACSIEHSERCAAALQKAGFRARHIDGEFLPGKRDELIEEIKTGKIDILCCCMLLTEGWDLPECDLVIMARPTRSESLYIQMANRGARRGKHRPIILDHACNTVMHRYSWIDREWSLDGVVLGDPKKLVDYRICRSCGCINDVDEEFCEECGLSLKRERKLSPAEQAQLQLVEWSKQEKLRRAKKIRDFAEKRGFGKKWIEKVEELWLV